MSETTSQALRTSWFSFGQAHAHAVGGVTYDRNCIVKITAADPRSRMVEVFGNKWCWEYHEQPDMRFFPRGVFEV